MALRGVLRRVADGDMRGAGHHGGPGRGFGGGQRAVDVHRVMAVTFEHVPATGGKARLLVGHVRQRHLAVDGDAVVVPQHDQPRQLQLARKADRFLRNALHQAAVARDDPGVVVLDPGPPTRAQVFLGNGKADRIGDALTQRAGRRLDPGDMAVFRVACGDGAPLAEVLDLVQRHVGIAGQVQKRIDQHRPMPGRQDEPVTVGPARGLGVELQVLFEQNRRHIGHAHRHPRMARVGSGDRVQRQGADRGGAHPVVGVLCAKGLDIQGGIPLAKGRARRRPRPNQPDRQDQAWSPRPWEERPVAFPRFHAKIALDQPGPIRTLADAGQDDAGDDNGQDVTVRSGEGVGDAGDRRT